jgi:hypothetical protein
MSNASILITRPRYDPITRYFYEWSGEIKKFAESKGFAVLDLRAEKATRDHFESYLKKHFPSFLFLNGHGNADVILGYDNQVLVDLTSVIETAIIYARSCDAAKTLGIYLVNNGVGAFIGYKRKFICGVGGKSSKLLEDGIARLFLEPSNLVPSTLLKLHTAEDAHSRSLDAMYRNFRKMISSTASSEEHYAARWLWSNIHSQVLLGDRSARI